MSAKHNLLVCVSQGVSGTAPKGFHKKRFTPTSKAAPPAAQEIAKVLLGPTTYFYLVHCHTHLDCNVGNSLLHCLPAGTGVVPFITTCQLLRSLMWQARLCRCMFNLSKRQM